MSESSVSIEELRKFMRRASKSGSKARKGTPRKKQLQQSTIPTKPGGRKARKPKY